MSLLSKDCQWRTDGDCSPQRSPKAPKEYTGRWRGIPATIKVKGPREYQETVLDRSPHDFSGVRKWAISMSVDVESSTRR